MSLDLKIIKNYSQALFVSAKELSLETKILEQIQFFADLVQENDVARNVLCSPIVDRAIKIKLVDLFVVKYKFESLSKQFLNILIKNNRCSLLPRIVKVLSELIAEENGIKSAQVISAYKLGKKEMQMIQKIIEEKLKKKVNLEAQIDLSLIGGMVIKYDSNLIDYSIQGALSKIEKACIKIVL